WKEIWTNGHGGTFRYVKGSVDSWLALEVNDMTTTWIGVIEKAAQTTKLTLPPPAAAPEKVADDADFPYLGHYPGSKLSRTEPFPRPLDVTPPDGEEPVLAGNGYVLKSYSIPEKLSVLQLTTVYEEALRASGWTIVGKLQRGLLAHYTKNGRDVWA